MRRCLYEHRLKLSLCMISTNRKKPFPLWFINAFALVNSNFFARERERERETRRFISYIYNLTHARKYNHFYLPGNLSLLLLFIEYIFNVLSSGKVLKQIAVGIPLRDKHVLSYCVYKLIT